MEGDPQAVLFAGIHQWQRPSVEDEPPAENRKARVKPINRNQLLLRPVDVEQLIGPLHPARAVWELIGQQDLTGFYEKIDAVEGAAGRSAIDPRLMLSL